MSCARRAVRRSAPRFVWDRRQQTSLEPISRADRAPPPNGLPLSRGNRTRVVAPTKRGAVDVGCSGRVGRRPRAIDQMNTPVTLMETQNDAARKPGDDEAIPEDTACTNHPNGCLPHSRQRVTPSAMLNAPRTTAIGRFTVQRFIAWPPGWYVIPSRAPNSAAQRDRKTVARFVACSDRLPRTSTLFQRTRGLPEVVATSACVPMESWRSSRPTVCRSAAATARESLPRLEHRRRG